MQPPLFPDAHQLRDFIAISFPIFLSLYFSVHFFVRCFIFDESIQTTTAVDDRLAAIVSVAARDLFAPHAGRVLVVADAGGISAVAPAILDECRLSRRCHRRVPHLPVGRATREFTASPGTGRDDSCVLAGGDSQCLYPLSDLGPPVPASRAGLLRCRLGCFLVVVSWAVWAVETARHGSHSGNGDCRRTRLGAARRRTGYFTRQYLAPAVRAECRFAADDDSRTAGGSCHRTGQHRASCPPAHNPS